MSSVSDRLPEISPSTVVASTLVVASVTFGFFLFYQFSQVILLIVAAIILSLAMHPVVKRLKTYGVHPILTMGIIYSLLVLVAILFAIRVVPLITDQITPLVGTLTDLYNGSRMRMLSSTNFFFVRVAMTMPASLPFITPAAPDPEAAASFTSLAESLTFVQSIALNSLGILLIMMIAFYWTLETDRLKKSVYLILPTAWRDRAKDIVREIESKVSGFIVGQGILCLIIGAVSLVAYLLIGLPYALTLAILAGIMEAVPFVGPTLAAIPTVFVAFAVSPSLGLWALVVSLIIQMLENQILYPRVMKNSVGINPIVVLMALLALGTLFGVLGALVAIPIAATLQIIIDQTLFAITDADPEEFAGRGKVSRLRYEIKDLIHDIRVQVRQKKGANSDVTDQIEDSIEAIALDLDSLLARQEAKV